MTTAKQCCEQAMAFLDAQRLAPLPANYQLAYGFVEGRHAALIAAVAVIIDGGVRMTQAEADRLQAQFFGRAAGYESTYAMSADAVRHQTLKLTDLASAARDATGSLNRELSDTLPGLGGGDAPGLGALVVSMLQKTQATEDKLASTTAELQTLREKLEAVQGDAERDALTGLPNRRGIDAHLAGLRGTNEPTVIAICDIDRFKSYNDRYGHAVGDRVLKTVATSLRSSLADHFVGRWGGEEFIVVAQTTLENGIVLLDRAKAELGERHFKLRETDEPLGRVTFSAGISRLEDDVTATLERADALLYRAKHAGRDQVIGQ